MGKRTYKAVDFHRVDWTQIEQRLSGQRVVLAVDVAKKEFVAALMTCEREAVRTFKWCHPHDTRAVVEQLAQLPGLGEAVLEPTGTYGDALCYQLRQAGVTLYQVSPKRVADATEIYDGVPSRHDGKSAYVIGRLHLERVSKRWDERDETRRTLMAQANQLSFCQDQAQRSHNRLEAQLARHWPELEGLLKLDSVSLLSLVSEFGSPRAVAADGEAARALLAREGGRFLAADKIEAVIDSARTTLGQPCVDGEARGLQELAKQLLTLKRQRQRLERALEAAVERDPQLSDLRASVGGVTTAVIYAEIGAPRDYPNTRSYLKALGMNLKERSSGQHKGLLRLTKRGPGNPRRYLYFAVLRWIERSQRARRWYEAKVARDGGCKKKAIVALMRKLAAALWHVGQGEAFDEARLFDDATLAAEH